ncbi:MFS transporter [Herbaspirillum sp. LeCh32-8]|uniref:MFS transporter n=1 Tax=Herbaspirillum sp. LeCh32-8 TaxID=2821356 RepID=UPI001AE8D32F|nr:MFS transporter [Herbaspirillum sp. LeCh32-8]MBP0600659.1 MFS transporter [Herbaspirillum sp. LeCh32-8]
MSGEERSITWLSRLNFFLADVRDGLGPFLGIFLMGHGWRADDIGYVMTIGGIAGMLATTPAGALIDATRHKRMLVAVGAILVVAGSLVLILSTSFAPVAASQVGIGIVGAVIGPAIAGLTLGMVGQRRLASQLGRNEAWNHAGNVASAALAGAVSYYWGITAVFVLMALMALASLACLARIDPAHIDHEAARGAASSQADGVRISPLRLLLRSRVLLALAIAMMLFHLGNAAMLPLLGQSATAQGAVSPGLYTALTIIVAQIVMVPVALAAGRLATRYGYVMLVTVALAALPLRGLVAGYWDSPWCLLPVQILDGIGAGILGVALPGLVAQLLQGSGHINVGLGAVTAVQSVGAALSPALAGMMAQRHGYGMAFLMLTVFALLALIIWYGLVLRAGNARPMNKFEAT